MSKLGLLVLVLFLALVGAGGLFLATWEASAPTSTVEKVIPNDRFQR